MGAPLTYAWRSALFTLVGIAGEDTVVSTVTRFRSRVRSAPVLWATLNT